MNRRADANQALSYAVELANDVNLPVLYYEGLTCSYPYASDRFHRFILEGVPETEKRLALAASDTSSTCGGGTPTRMMRSIVSPPGRPPW